MASDWGTTMGNGGTTAQYWSNLGGTGVGGGGGHGRGGGWGLNAQMQGLMGEFPDINESINALLSYAEQMRQRKRLEAQKAEMQAKNEQARREAEAKQAQAKAQEQAYMASPYFNSPLKQFMQTKALLDSNTFPGTPNTFFQNFPATSALMYGKNVFPSGWDAYAQLAQAGGPMSAAAINTAGENWRHITPGANPYPTSSGGGR